MAQGRARPAVVPVATGREAEVVEVLSAAFFRYPVMRHILADSGTRYRHHLTSLVGFFVAARLSRDEPVLALELEGRLVAAALMTPPNNRPPPGKLQERRKKLWHRLGWAAEQRYQQLGEVWATVAVEEPNLHLNMIGVSPAHAGTGLGTLLLDQVHCLSRRLPDSTGVSLTTEWGPNVAFYRHCGYQLVGQARVDPGLETWGMFRPDR